MRILHTESAVGMGGQELRVLQDVVGLKNRGHHVFLSVPPGSQLARCAEKIDVSIIPMNMTVWSWFSLVVKFRNIFSKYEIDIVNTHGSIDSWTASMAARLSRRGPKIIRSRHKSTPVSPTLRHRLLYGKFPHAVITMGERMRQGLIHSCKVEPSKIFSIPTGVDLSKYYPREPERALKEKLGIAINFPIVGVIAFLRAYKGIEVFLQAARFVLDLRPEVRFLVVGDGQEKSRLEEIIQAFGMNNKVYLLGHREDIPQLLSIFDVFVLPSIGTEGIPQALLQAMAMGIAVVATPVGGIPEIVKDGETGLLCPPHSPVDLGKNICRLLKDRDLRKRLGRNGHEFVVESLSVEKMLDSMETLYGSLLPGECFSDLR